MVVKKCPRCHQRSYRKQGSVRAGPKRGFRSVWFCGQCGYRSIENP